MGLRPGLRPHRRKHVRVTRHLLCIVSAARAIAGRTRRGEVIWILTTLPAAQAPSAELLQLYRLRWQIELFFKRLKSLLHFDTLPSRQGPTARSWMLSRLLAAALAQKLAQPSGPLSPWGYEVQTERLHA
jgi:IS4 transposase